MKDKPSFPARMAGWEYQYERAEKYLKLLRRCEYWMKEFIPVYYWTPEPEVKELMKELAKALVSEQSEEELGDD